MLARLFLAVCVVSSYVPVAEANQRPSGPCQKPTPESETEPETSVPIVITASKSPEPLVNAPATMTVIGEEAIENAPIQNVTELMRLVPGVNITRTSARDVNITSRGATGTLEDSTLVLFDGRSIYQDFFGFVMWDFIPVDPFQIKQIEVIRGPASAVWGANALTGVVNVISKTPREMAGTSASIEFGHFDRTRTGGNYDGGGLFSINATHAEAPNDCFAFKISAGLLAQEAFLRPNGAEPGTGGLLFTNRGTKQPKLEARADYDFADGRSTLIMAGGITGTEGIIHSGLGPLAIQRGSTFKYGRIAYQRDAFRLQMFVNALDADATILLLHDVDNSNLEPTFENQTYDVEFSNANSFRGRHFLSYGGNFRSSRFDLSLAPDGSSRLEGGAYAQDRILLSDRAQWVVGARIDRLGGVDKTVASPRTAFIFRPRPRHTIRFSFNRAFRAPSFFNSFLRMQFLYPENLPSIAVGNLGLKEETLTAYEAAYIGEIGPVTIGAATYVNDTRNMILFTQLESASLPLRFSYLNEPRIIDRGIELSLDARINRDLTGFVNYTWQANSEAHGFSVLELNQPPAHHVNAGVSLDPGKYFGSLSVSYQDKAFWQDVLAFHGWTQPYTVVNAGAGVRSNDGAITVAVRVTNLLNRTTQQHIFGDLIKRTITGEVRFGF
ncbi:MAG TPA: TonB-dependent receptor [Vicinamibacterales bacterium]|nr:TonB-dependent receptor [Vicinamibacterales bacterium]